MCNFPHQASQNSSLSLCNGAKPPNYLIYGVARSLLGVARMDVGKLIELLILCIILCILGIILGILCILLGIILGISRILGINISELSKRDPNHKKKPRPL